MSCEDISAGTLGALLGCTLTGLLDALKTWSESTPRKGSSNEYIQQPTNEPEVLWGACIRKEFTYQCSSWVLTGFLISFVGALNWFVVQRWPIVGEWQCSSRPEHIFGSCSWVKRVKIASQRGSSRKLHHVFSEPRFRMVFFRKPDHCQSVEHVLLRMWHPVSPVVVECLASQRTLRRSIMMSSGRPKNITWPFSIALLIFYILLWNSSSFGIMLDSWPLICCNSGCLMGGFSSSYNVTLQNKLYTKSDCLMVIHGSYPHVQTALSRFLGCTLFLFLRQTVLRVYTVQNWWETVSKIPIFDARVTTPWKISKEQPNESKGTPFAFVKYSRLISHFGWQRPLGQIPIVRHVWGLNVIIPTQLMWVLIQDCCSCFVIEYCNYPKAAKPTTTSPINNIPRCLLLKSPWLWWLNHVKPLISRLSITNHPRTLIRKQ